MGARSQPKSANSVSMKRRFDGSDTPEWEYPIDLAHCISSLLRAADLTPTERRACLTLAGVILDVMQANRVG